MKEFDKRNSFHHYNHVSVMQLGHLLTRSGLTYPVPVQRLNLAILPLDLPCSGTVTHSGEILNTGKSHGKKPDETANCI